MRMARIWLYLEAGERPGYEFKGSDPLPLSLAMHRQAPPPFLLIHGDSLIHQAIWDLGPVECEFLKVVKQGGDLLLDVFLQQGE